MGKIIAEGKTKRIIEVDDDLHNEVLILNKDSITAGDGARKSEIVDKGIMATKTTCNVFGYLNAQGVKTHFVRKVDGNVFRARKVIMIPIELVARRVAYGSYLKRNPSIESGTRFDEIRVEFFYKDDENHDPLMVISENDNWILYDPKKPIENPIGEISNEFGLFKFKGREIDQEKAIELEKITKKVFLLLEEAWAKQDVLLVDMKIECGFDTETGEMLIADVIDNDSWRIWPKGDESQMKDKETYRLLKEPTEEELAKVAFNYKWVAEATRKFLD